MNQWQNVSFIKARWRESDVVRIYNRERLHRLLVIRRRDSSANNDFSPLAKLGRGRVSTNGGFRSLASFPFSLSSKLAELSHARGAEPRFKLPTHPDLGSLLRPRKKRRLCKNTRLVLHAIALRKLHHRFSSEAKSALGLKCADDQRQSERADAGQKTQGAAAREHVCMQPRCKCAYACAFSQATGPHSHTVGRSYCYAPPPKSGSD